ncbi:MAG: hypothetical protein AAF666_12575 [Pseudomonadota bacterium]
MTDVLKIALARRAELSDEVAKLDDFIRMAEALIRNNRTDAPASPSDATRQGETGSDETQGETSVRTAMRRFADTPSAEGTDVPRPNIIRRSGVAAGN